MHYRRSDDISYIKPSLEDFLGTYNELLASILVKNSGFFRFVASATIGRLEAQTHFFERLEKYTQLHKLLKEDASLNIELAADDNFLYAPLVRDFKGRVRRGGDLSLPLKMKRSISLKKAVFLPRIAAFLAKTIFFSIAVPKPKGKYSSIIRTYFDFRCTGKDGVLREEYFGELLPDLARISKVLVVYKMIHSNLKEFTEYLKLSKNSWFESCLVGSFLSPISIIRAVGSYLTGRIKLTERYLYRGIDITAILQLSINEDYFSLRDLDPYIEYEAAGRILDLDPERILLPYENQCWEKVYPLIKDARKGSRTKIIAFQHTGFSFKLLEHFPARSEIGLPFFPDKIPTVGAITKKVLEEYGSYSSLIVEGAALRHTKLLDNGSFKIADSQSALQGSVVYAFSYDIARYEKIFNVLVKAFSDSKIKVYLKIHPDYYENDVIKALGIKLPSNFYPAQKTSWDEIYKKVDCVFYNDNSIGLEGIIRGLKTFSINEIVEPIYECDRMFYFSEWQTKLDMEGLMRLRHMLESGDFRKDFDREKIADYINMSYNPYSKEKYLESYL